MSLNLTSDSLWWHFVSMEELWGVCSTICHMKLSPDLTNWKKGIVNSISTTCKFLWNWHTNCTTISKQWLGRDMFALDQFHIAWCFSAWGIYLKKPNHHGFSKLLLLSNWMVQEQQIHLLLIHFWPKTWILNRMERSRNEFHFSSGKWNPLWHEPWNPGSYREPCSGVSRIPMLGGDWATYLKNMLVRVRIIFETTTWTSSQEVRVNYTPWNWRNWFSQSHRIF